MTSDRRGRGWMWTGSLMMLGAVVAVVVGVTWSVRSFDMTAVQFPGEVSFDMPTPGKMTVGYEPISVIDGRDIASPEEPPLIIVFEKIGSSVVVPMEPPVRPARYQWGERVGAIVGMADLTAGTWRMVGRSPDGDPQPVVYSYGRTRPFQLVAPVLVAALIAAVLGPGGLGCLVIGIMLLSRGRKEVRAPTPG